MAIGRMAKAAAQGAKLAVKYGPQAKIAWDKGGKKATLAASRRALTLNARRRALAHASGVIDGAILRIAPEGSTMYVVFSGDQPIATYPAHGAPFTTLLAHADLDRRERPGAPRRPRRPGRAPRELG